jgi:hypothetical protein
MNTELSQAEPAPELEYVTFKGAETPVKVFFYERLTPQGPSGFIAMPGDKSDIIAVSENEAASMSTAKWRQVGVGDGKKYAESIMNCGVGRGQRIPLEQARKILKAAFNAELEASRGKYERPVLQTYHFMGASHGTQGYEELARRRQ